jgi:hypothetical protein
MGVNQRADFSIPRQFQRTARTDQCSCSKVLQQVFAEENMLFMENARR